MLEPTLESIVVKRPKPTERDTQNLYLDNAYSREPAPQAIQKFGYIPHIQTAWQWVHKKPWPQRRKKHPPRRWVVERTMAWLSKCRGILVRYEKKAINYLGLIQLACALLWYRRIAFDSF